MALNTAIFSVATGLSRIAGLIREIVAARYFGTSGAASAFTLAFQVPNLVRALFADAALSSAFVPVFTELLEHKQPPRGAPARERAVRADPRRARRDHAAVHRARAGRDHPAVHGRRVHARARRADASGSRRVLFPIIVLLGLNGLLVGILNAHDHFTIPAIAPLVWNLVIIAGLVVLTPLFEGDDRIYAYAIGVRRGHARASSLMALPGRCARLGFPIWQIRLPRRDDPRIRRVLLLMLPVTIGLGLINFDLVLNSLFGSLVSDEAPAAIDKAFRIYMLPQGMFSRRRRDGAVPAAQPARRPPATCDRPARACSAIGMRQIALLLIPAAAAIDRARGADHRGSLYQRGEFDAESTDLVTEALFWFAISPAVLRAGTCSSRARSSRSSSRGLPTALARRLARGQRRPCRLALYGRSGSAGVVLGTVVSNGGDDGLPGVPPAPASSAAWSCRDAARGRARCCSPRPRSAASPTASGTALDDAARATR